MTDNPIIWWELGTQDAEKSVEFFKTVFGWELTYNEKAGFYTMQHEPQMTGGGIFTMKKTGITIKRRHTPGPKTPISGFLRLLRCCRLEISLMH